FNPQLNESLPTATITKESSYEAKYELFCSLFAGRPDMHGKRYYQKSTGSSGYSPVCNNQFIRGLCTKGDKSKPRIKCVDCEHQNFETITLKEFESHIKGLSKTHDDVLGAYAIDRDAMCSFIVADFDAKNDTADGALDSLQDSVATFMRLCERHTIPTYLERSRSGKGFHIWLFFDSPVPAKDARRLFCSLITDAMEENPRISFASYDRLFPHQDTIPSTGFGNLIALPLQGGVGKLGCSVFVDGYFNPYPDQWVFLSHVKRFTYADLKSILMRISHRTDIGNLADASVEELHEKPWEKKQPELPLVQQDFTGTLTIVEANMLHIKKDQLSTRAHNRIKRLAAFRNPEFYEAQKMHRDTAIFPRVLSTSDETNEYLSLPRGIKDSLLVMLNEGNIDYDLVDKMQHGNRIHATFKGMLREEQASAANALLAHDTGVLEATTGFGKTIIGISLIAHRSVNTLILVNNKNLLTQWKTTLGSFLDIADEPLIYLTPTGRERKCPTIGEYSGAKKRLSGLVDIAMMQSLFRNGEVSDIVKNYGVVIIDECHHVPSFTFTSVLKEVSARYVYGLTATPERKDGHESILYAHCGPTRYKVNPLDQARKRPFEQFVVPRFTNSLPEDANEKFNITKLYGTLASDHRRNELIITDIIACIEADRSPLVLTERTEHVAELARLLKTRFSNVLTVTGKMSDLEKRTFLNRIQDMGENEQFIIVATGKFIGEGFDFDRLDTLFLTLPISWKGTITQY
ncbi:MAG: DEAD/DEAH box helicase family protein, partial [Raoultibacter sp.]